MKKKIILTIIPTTLAIGIIIFVLIFLKQKQNQKAGVIGSCTIEIINTTETVKSEKVDFKENDTLVSILENKFDAKTSYSEYGAFIESFPNCVPDNSNGEWIIFYVNDESATEGVSYYKLTDGYKYSFKIETFTYWKQ